MGVTNPRDRTYPECSYMRSVHHCLGFIEQSPNCPCVFTYLTDCASSLREHRLARRLLGSREGAEWPRGLKAARMTSHGQNLGCGAWIVLNGSGSGSREAFRHWLGVQTVPAPALNPGKWPRSGGSGLNSKYLDSGIFARPRRGTPKQGSVPAPAPIKIPRRLRAKSLGYSVFRYASRPASPVRRIWAVGTMLGGQEIVG